MTIITITKHLLFRESYFIVKNIKHKVHFVEVYFILAHSSWKFQVEYRNLISTRPRRTALSVSCPCLVSVRIFRKIVSGVFLLSEFCPDFLSGVCLSGFFLSRFCPVSEFCPDFQKNTVRCLSAGQGQDRAVRTFAVVVRWRLVRMLHFDSEMIVCSIWQTELKQYLLEISETSSTKVLTKVHCLYSVSFQIKSSCNIIIYFNAFRLSHIQRSQLRHGLI